MKVPRVFRFRPELRREIEARLLAGDFHSYRKFADEINHRTLSRISKSALHAHHQRLIANKKKDEP